MTNGDPIAELPYVDEHATTIAASAGEATR
jgi:hypothetical protein